MHLLALGLAVAGMVAVWSAGAGMYLAMSAALLGGAIAWVAFRQRTRPGAARLVAAAALAVAGMVLTLALIRYVLTLIAIDKLDSLLGG